MIPYTTYLVKKWFTVTDKPLNPGIYAIRKELATIDLGLEYGLIEVKDSTILTGENVAEVEIIS